MSSTNNTSVSNYRMSFFNRFIKRTFDLLCAFFGLLIFSPIIILIYFLIFFRFDGPVIFKQERIGMNGKPFTLYKFRTMINNAERNGMPALCSDNDSRLTKMGKFLREHHLDEFPQLINVIKGDMSFVGYRPERQYYIDKIMEHNADYRLLYAIRPGLFSKATLYNGYTDTMEKMLERLNYDLEYLRTMSLYVDIKIIYLTAISILTGKKF